MAACLGVRPGCCGGGGCCCCGGHSLTRPFPPLAGHDGGLKQQKNGLPTFGSFLISRKEDPDAYLCSSGHPVAVMPEGKTQPDGSSDATTCAKYRWYNKATGAVWIKADNPTPASAWEWALDYVFIQCKHGECASKNGGTQTKIEHAAFVAHCKSLPAVKKRGT